MTGDRLFGVDLKLARARYFLQELDRANNAYLSTTEYKMDVVTHATDSSYTVTVVSPAPPSQALAPVFGDLVHNLRSALDYLARQLVIASGGKPADRIKGQKDTAFPINLSPLKGGQLSDVPPGLPAPMRQLLDQMQPYHSQVPGEHPLAQLHQLDITDKHRLLNIVHAIGNASVAFYPDGPEELIANAATNRYTVDLTSSVPQRIVVDREDLHDPARPHYRLTYGLSLVEPSTSRGMPVIMLAMWLSQHVESEVIDKFRHLF